MLVYLHYKKRRKCVESRIIPSHNFIEPRPDFFRSLFGQIGFEKLQSALF